MRRAIELALVLVPALALARCGFDEPILHVAAPTAPPTSTPVVTDPSQPSELGPIHFPSLPYELVAGPGSRGSAIAVHGDEVFVVDEDNGQLVVLDAATLGVLRRIPVGARPEHVVLDRSGNALVTVRDDGAIVRVPARASAVSARLALGGAPWGVALDPEELHAYVSLATTGEVVRIDADLSVERDRVAVGGRLRGVAVDATGRVAVADLRGDIVIIDRAHFAREARLSLSGPGTGTPTRALAVAPGPSGDRFYVAHVYAAATGPSGYGWSTPSTLPHEPVVTTVGTLSYDTSAFPIPDVDQPSDIVAHPTEPLVLVAAAGSDELVALHDQGGVIGRVSVGAAPRAVAIGEDGLTAYVLEGDDFSVSAIDLTPMRDGWLVADDMHLLRSGTFGEDPLAPELRFGRRLFHHRENRHRLDAVLACASCHVDGGDDGLTWTIDGVPRQTPSLAGRLVGTAPFGWLGAKPTLADEMRAGFGRMGIADPTAFSDAELKALEDYLERGLVAPRNPNRRAVPTQAEVRGRALFMRSEGGCVTCHSGPMLADGQSWDVGTDLVVPPATTAVGVDTPSLLGVWATAPYLHDGRAPTLEKLLEQHGGAEALTAAERDALAAWLRTL
ncbi:MAG: hypothetical protein U1F43_02150 [Myxococcota bacterium]